jgi:predicted DNA-binding transcriptional regulator AlpA
MKLEYVMEKREGYLYFVITGQLDRKEFSTYAKIVIEACQTQKINKILVNALQMSGTNLTTMERYLIGEKVAEIFPPAIKISVAWPEKDIDKFAETVATNRGGFINVEPDLERAEKWLLMRI